MKMVQRYNPYLFSIGGIGKGQIGVSMAIEIGYTVPEGIIDFWINRFKEFKVSFSEKVERFGETCFPFTGKSLKTIEGRIIFNK